MIDFGLTGMADEVRAKVKAEEQVPAHLRDAILYSIVDMKEKHGPEVGVTVECDYDQGEMIRLSIHAAEPAVTKAEAEAVEADKLVDPAHAPEVPSAAVIEEMAASVKGKLPKATRGHARR